MATSGITAFDLTAREMIREAAIRLGVISGGEQLESDEADDMRVAFNLMLKSWAAEGNLFREASGTVTITGATGAGTLPQGVRELVSVRHVVSATNYRPLQRWNRTQYYQLPNRAAVGNPTVYYATSGSSQDAIYIWPVPAANITLHLDYYRSAEIVTDLAETVDIPQDWAEAAIYGLAARSVEIFGATNVDPARVDRVTQMAGGLYTRMLDQDRPDSYYFEPWDA